MKTLLGTVAAAALVLGMGTAAYAANGDQNTAFALSGDVGIASHGGKVTKTEDNDFFDLDVKKTFNVHDNTFNNGDDSIYLGGEGDLGVVASLAKSHGFVHENRAETGWHSDSNNSISSDSFGGAKGAFNVGQNAGANSQVGNTMSVAAILGGTENNAVNLAVAVAHTSGAVIDNCADIWGDQANTISASFKGTLGAFNVSQNAGANSLVQNTMAVGTIGSVFGQ